MYYYIKGEPVLKQDNFAVIDNSGVGYKIYTSQNTLNSLNGNTVTMYTYLYVREDVYDLYGFSTQDELTLFLQLLSVSGVGPKAALAVLSVLTPQQLICAVVTNDAKSITKAQGVGAKMAQRIILELKDKLKNSDIIPEDMQEEAVISADSQSEAVQALVVLGYSEKDAKNAVAKIDPDCGTEKIIKLALAELMR